MFQLLQTNLEKRECYKFPSIFHDIDSGKKDQQKDSCSQTVASLRMRSVTSLTVQDDNNLNTLLV